MNKRKGELKFQLSNWTVLKRPQLASSNFHLFGPLKKATGGKIFRVNN
jgi:hypothetical protein